MTMTETQIQTAVPAPETVADGPPPAPPRATSGDGTAPLRGNQAQLLQFVLFIAGAVLLPGGLVVIGLGWYGSAHTPYVYNQNSYLISGGILGLGITLVGGFLYFGSWLARMAIDQKEGQAKIAEALIRLAEVTQQVSVADDVVDSPVVKGARKAAPAARTKSAGLVVAGNGTTLHRADCDLVAGRDDLVPAPADTSGLTPCRLCQS